MSVIDRIPNTRNCIATPRRRIGPMRLAAASLLVALTAPVLTGPVAARAAQSQAVLSDATIQRALDTAYAQVKNVTEGKNADYIPALAKVDPKIFGIVLVTTDGRVFTAGDVKSEVSIQSISKVFTMAKVMDEQGPQAIQDRIGTDATGMRFNSIVSIEQNQ